MISAAVALLVLQIGPPSPKFGLSSFYKKCLMVRGLPIASSDKTSDRALYAARDLVEHMLAKRPEVVKYMLERKLRIAVMAQSEQTLDIPEHSDLQKAFPETDWNKRARGLGATVERPCVSGAEENLLGLPGDRYKGECILIHEFGHTMLNFGMEPLDAKFRARMKQAYDHAKSAGTWKNTYAMTNIDEYWAEGVQSWFDSNQKGPPEGNGVHNDIWNRKELLKRDPELAMLLGEVFAADWSWTDPTGK
jgi:alpha-glucosidase